MDNIDTDGTSGVQGICSNINKSDIHVYRDYRRRGFFGRQPLCGTPVVSRISVI